VGLSEDIDEPLEPVERAKPEKPAKPPSVMALKPLEVMERRVGLYVALVGAAFVFGQWALFWSRPGVVWLPIEAVALVALLWASQRRGRMATSLACFLLASSVYPLPFAGLPFIVFGLWLWFRGRPSPEEIQARRAARAEVMEAKRAARRGKPAPVSATGRKAPPQSKRYTPPAGKR
jgi:hypothetical protein